MPLAFAGLVSVAAGEGTGADGGASVTGALFAGKPAIRRVGAAREIRFAVTKPTDVTVRIVDSTGKVVRLSLIHI